MSDSPFPLEATPAEAQAAIAEEFAFFGDWSERYQYLIDLGRKLPDLPESLKTDEFRLHGCQSNVWIVGDGDADRLDFRAISDSAIVSGLIYLALRVFGFQPPSWRNLGWFAAILTIDLVLAWVLYRCIEHPFEGRMRSWKNRRDERRLGVSRRSTVQ